MRTGSKIALGSAAVLVVGCLTGYVVLRNNVKAGSGGLGTAVGAQIGCADVFLMHRDVKEAEKNDVHSLGAAAGVIGLHADMQRGTVTATIPAIISRVSVYTPGRGCTLLTDHEKPPAARTGAEAPSPAATAASALLPQGAAPNPAALAAAVSRAFSEPNVASYPDTRAILVIKDGHIVAERYAPGFSASTRFLGWSMTKSVMSALAGVLVRDGKLSLDAPAPVPAWRVAGDPRGAITLRNLLNMSSGLKFVEDYVPGSNSAQMLFHEPAMAKYAESLPLEHPAGTAWSYSSGTANIVSGIVFNAVGGSADAFNAFAARELYGPAGMSSMLIEPDESGAPVGSSYGYATAQDWARFGLLYLNRGVVDGRRILPESWIDFSKAPAPADPTPGYGGFFWLNQGPAIGKTPRSYPHCPDDLYSAEGHNGQFVAIVPSANVVIVRMGWTPEGQHFNVDRYFCGILDALKSR